MTTALDWGRAVDAVTGASSIAVCCHVSPDGDALGSMLGLGMFLERSGKKVWMSWGSEAISVPPQYAFLPGLETVIPPSEVPMDLDAFVAIDCADIGRLEELQPAFAGAHVKVVIDHHISNAGFGDVNIVDATRASAAELAAELIKRMGGEPSADEATCLYAGIVTDTGRFQYSNTTVETLRTAADLRERGVDHDQVNIEIYESSSFMYLRVLGEVLSRAVLDGTLVWSSVKQSDLQGLGLDETEHFIDVLRAVRESKLAVILKEQESGEFKGSLRSRGQVDVAKLAQRFGGGGHQRAAGFTAQGTVEQIIERMKGYLSEP